MQQRIDEHTLKALVGQDIYAVKKDGAIVYGKLVQLDGHTLMLEAYDPHQARFGPIIPLVLFDLLAIGLISGWGGGGCGFGGCGPGPGFSPYGPGPVGYPGQYPGYYR